MSSDYVIVGRIRKPHGIHGELVVEPMCDAPGETFAPGRHVFAGDTVGALESETPRKFEITRARPFKQGWLLSLRGFGDRNEAELWRNRFLLVPGTELAPAREGEVWLHELPGMRVIDVHGVEIGAVSDVDSLPQGLMLAVKTPTRSVSVPFVDAIVIGIDRDARTLTIDPPEGLLEL